MATRFARCLVLAAVAAFVMMSLVTGAAAQVTNISDCGTLSTFGQTYKRIANMNALRRRSPRPWPPSP